jgi:toxin ParE1/3/4
MIFRVEFAVRAARDLEALYLEKNAHDSVAAARWYNGLESAIGTLAASPHRCPAAPEAGRLKRTLRHLLYGRKPHVYRVIYETDEVRQIVFILTIRHGARRQVRASDLR